MIANRLLRSLFLRPGETFLEHVCPMSKCKKDDPCKKYKKGAKDKKNDPCKKKGGDKKEEPCKKKGGDKKKDKDSKNVCNKNSKKTGPKCKKWTQMRTW